MGKILLIEDEAPLMDALDRALRSFDYEIVKASTGTKGLEQAFTEKPDLIVLDLILPELDGLELLQKLREDAWGKTAKVIVLTNLTDKEKLEQAEKYNVTDYIVKSNISINDLADVIKKSI